MSYKGWVTLSSALIPVCIQGGSGADRLVLRGKAAQASFAIDGGGLVELRIAGHAMNPLNWELAEEFEARQPGKPHLQGHFLCLDRWGAPSEAEIRNGMPFHGEAPRIPWRVEKGPESSGGQVGAEMTCTLPIAVFEVRRRVRLSESQALLTVVESVTNRNPTGRIYNMVQHPTIAPPFLSDATEVDTNAKQGFLQAAGPPRSGAAGAPWPNIVIDGRTVDLRHLKAPAGQGTTSDVSSFVFDDAEEYGWITSASRDAGLLIGYVWRTREYPWLNVWRHVVRGAIAARGLEFGTTGYHQTYPVLVQTGRILDRPLYAYLDAGETVRKSYAAFLLEIPRDFRGVAGLAVSQERIVVTERGEGARTLTLLGAAFPRD